MHLVANSSGHRLLLVWRTETLFYTPERRRLSDDWNQVRFTSESLPQTRAIDHSLDQPLPLPDASFDGIYCFHVIEHLNLPGNRRLMADIYRLLKPGGVYRASTPDLEFVASEYLQRLNDQVRCASTDNYARYHWAVCNLIDQCVRDKSGGEMLRALESDQYSREYIKQVNGDSLDFLLPQPASAPTPPQPASPSIPAPATQGRTALTPLRLIRGISRRIRRRLRKDHPAPLPVERTLEQMHEKNLWLFDRISLSRLFSETGLQEVTVADHRTSSIPSWNRYNFDQSAFGEYPLEPSLYVEGIK